MTVRSVVLFFLCALAALFLIVNWNGIMAPVPVNLLYTEVQAPLGFILLIVLGTLWAAGIVWALVQQAATLFQLRHAYKEVTENKKLADKAEGSRLQEAKTALHEELTAIDARLQQHAVTCSKEQTARIDRLAEQIQALAGSVQRMEENVKRVADAQGVELPCRAPEKEEPKKSFFGFMGHKQTVEPEKPAVESAVKTAVPPLSDPAAPAQTAGEDKDTQAGVPVPAAAVAATPDAAGSASEKKHGIFGSLFTKATKEN